MPFLAWGGIEDMTCLERNGYKVSINPTNYLRLRENRRTGGTCEHSTTFVIKRSVYKDPKDEWFDEE